MGKYNTTQLYIDKAAERGIVHRDYIAHSLRWTHVLRFIRMGMSVLDVGCGINTPLLWTLYTNKFRPECYVGLDYRGDFSTKPEAFPFPVKLIGRFDATNEADWIHHLQTTKFDLISCFEVIEHMSKGSGCMLLENLSVFAGDSPIFLSTPCFNGSKAANHIYEWEYEELKEALEDLFVIEEHYGTFASQSDIYPVMSQSERELFHRLKKYYDSNFVSILFAPLHPAKSRNCIWRLRAK